jgi:8-oxo-dGTP pyrophosphatase MutT (NUDIX family)
MRLLRTFDAGNYDDSWNCYKREAVRAIIFRDSKIALVKCGLEGYYKFPGGGIEPGETHMQALSRETLEETGLKIIPKSVREFGALIEKRASIYGDPQIFEQHSYYYFAEAEDGNAQCSLDAYEAELDYHPVFTDLHTAIKANETLGGNYQSAFLIREAYIMELLKDRLEQNPQAQIR